MLIDDLKKILNPVVIEKPNDLLIPSRPEIKKLYIKLIEERNNNLDLVLKEVLISNIPPKHLCFSMDYNKKDDYCKHEEPVCFQQFSMYLDKTNKTINKKCDFILVCEFNEKYHVIFFELKSNRIEWGDVVIKFNNSRLFFKYLLSIQNIKDDNFFYHNVLMHYNKKNVTEKSNTRKYDFYKDISEYKDKKHNYPDIIDFNINRTISKPFISLDNLIT